MKEQLIKILETCLAYTRYEINYYDTLREIFILLCEVEYMFEFEVN